MIQRSQLRSIELDDGPVVERQPKCRRAIGFAVQGGSDKIRMICGWIRWPVLNSVLQPQPATFALEFVQGQFGRTHFDDSGQFGLRELSDHIVGRLLEGIEIGPICKQSNGSPVRWRVDRQSVRLRNFVKVRDRFVVIGPGIRGK